DHRYVKRLFVQFAGFENLHHASLTLTGIGTVHVLYK
ncbi:IS6 family transposase, partial [Bacillus cereus]